MKNKKLTLTIGIPAYNEEANIGRLLASLLAQRTDGIILTKIIVISDGSTDQTLQEVKKIKSNKIMFIENKKRQGLNPVQNQILKRTKDDVLVICNADVLPQGNDFLMNLVKPILTNLRVGIVGARIKSVEPSTLIGKILAHSADLKEAIYQKICRGNNVYLCHGQARAFSKAFYKKLKWPYDVPEDSYSYFECLAKGFKFHYAKNAVIYFSPSLNIKDHTKQSKRFTSGIKMLGEIFDKNFIARSYKIPVFLLLIYMGAFLIRKPVLTIGYIVIILLIRFVFKDRNVDHSQFEIAKSSKDLAI